MTSILNGRRVLVVDDELAIRKALEQRFLEEEAAVDTAGKVGTARDLIQEAVYDLIILDHRLPDGTGLALLEQLKADECPSAVVMMTAYSSTTDAVRAIKIGAADYVMKPFDLDEMVAVAERALDHLALRGEVQRYRSKASENARVENLVGRSACMQELRETLLQVADSGARTILISGESGTGKDLAAQGIHYSSPERDRPFLNITCTAIPEALLESELFGHEKGAFTDARRSKKGLFEEANGGTIFLDEIGDMPMSLQGKLLRFLESKTFRRLGGLREIQVNVRIIAASNRDLIEATEKRDFRRDLYYRLNVIPIEIPPLRDRKDDIPVLLNHFAKRFAKELRKEPRVFGADAIRLLSGYAWPGNVRELRNCVERAVLLARNETLGIEDLPRELQRSANNPEETGGNGLMTLPEGGVVLDDLIRSLLDQALIHSKGNKSRAAELLGIHRDQVRYWVKKYGLHQWVRTRPPPAEAAVERPAE